jgi:uncharacterized protein Yka (UPF0111/DUF47 family)
MSNEAKLNVTIAQRELRELADRLDSTANNAADACVLISTGDREGSEEYMKTVVKRAEEVLSDLKTLMGRLKLVGRWSA